MAALSAADQAVIDGIAGDTLRRLGYS
jgi:hypothetical protein